MHEKTSSSCFEQLLRTEPDPNKKKSLNRNEKMRNNQTMWQINKFLFQWLMITKVKKHQPAIMIISIQFGIMGYHEWAMGLQLSTTTSIVTKKCNGRALHRLCRSKPISYSSDRIAIFQPMASKFASSTPTTAAWNSVLDNFPDFQTGH